MQVVAGTTSRRLAAAVAESLDAELVHPEVRTFPDGEIYARVGSDMAGEDVAVVQTTLGNDRFMELMFLLDAVRAGGAARVVAVVPYYAYSRQDARFQAGEALSAEVIAGALSLYADALVTVDPHKEHVLDFFPGIAEGPSAVPELAAAFSARGVDLVLAPDAGALGRAAAAAEVMGVGHDHLEKTRLSGEEVVMKPKHLDAAGKTVAIVDDIISTGGTMATAALQLAEQGAEAVYCAATHGLFVGPALDRLAKAGVDEVVVTDTIEGAQSTVPAGPAAVRGILSALERLQ